MEKINPDGCSPLYFLLCLFTYTYNTLIWYFCGGRFASKMFHWNKWVWAETLRLGTTLSPSERYSEREKAIQGTTERKSLFKRKKHQHPSERFYYYIRLRYILLYYIIYHIIVILSALSSQWFKIKIQDLTTVFLIFKFLVFFAI